MITTVLVVLYYLLPLAAHRHASGLQAMTWRSPWALPVSPRCDHPSGPVDGEHAQPATTARRAAPREEHGERGTRDRVEGEGDDRTGDGVPTEVQCVADRHLRAVFTQVKGGLSDITKSRLYRTLVLWTRCIAAGKSGSQTIARSRPRRQLTGLAGVGGKRCPIVGS